jgi:hypothetical protein
LSLTTQVLALGAHGGSGGIVVVGDRAQLLWQYRARPTPLSRAYSLLLFYEAGRAPEVFAMEPDLHRLVGDAEIPHLYYRDRKGERLELTKLCLFYPKNDEWRDDMLLANTVIPWSNMWLFYFEDWLATGVWNGGGVHPVGAAAPKFWPRQRRGIPATPKAARPSAR